MDSTPACLASQRGFVLVWGQLLKKCIETVTKKLFWGQNYFKIADKQSNSQRIMKNVCAVWGFLLSVVALQHPHVSVWICNLGELHASSFPLSGLFFSFSVYVLDKSESLSFFCNFVFYLAQWKYKSCSKFRERAELWRMKCRFSAPCVCVTACIIYYNPIHDSSPAQQSNVTAKHSNTL